MHFRQAQAGEARALSELAYRSKAYWGYDAAWLAAARSTLTLSEETMAACHVTVLEAAGATVGFYTLRGNGEAIELDDLWVEPAAIGHGHGRRLFEHAAAQARTLGARALYLDADPNAEGFYRAMGAERVGDTPSTLFEGRTLPRMRYTLGTERGGTGQRTPDF